MAGAHGHWVFAYGSLMWDPCFEVAESVLAQVGDHARRFCLRSVRYRGTVEAPGLVLGLDPCPGAVCDGLALRIEERHWPEALAALREREMTTAAYREAWLPVRLADGRDLRALAFVMRPEHDHYAGGLDPAEQARIIARARGGRGANADYLFNTVRHLSELGVEDRELEALARAVRDVMGDGASAAGARNAG